MTRYAKWSWEEVRRAPVTLAKMPGVEDGKGYRQEPVERCTDDRDKHMAEKVRERRRKQMRQFVSIWGTGRGGNG